MRQNERVSMQIWRGLNGVPADLGTTIVTVGNFDGVHRGHQAVLERMVADAREPCSRA